LRARESSRWWISVVKPGRRNCWNIMGMKGWLRRFRKCYNWLWSRCK